MQRNKFVLLLVIYVAVASSQSTTTTTTESEANDGRIVGGYHAAQGQFPHMVSIRVSGSHACGGSILSRNVVLTAAHCVVGRVSDPSVLTVYAGSVFRSSDGISASVSRVIVHPNYINVVNGHDVALLILSSDLIFSRAIQPISLATSDPPASRYRTVIISGWGRVSNNGPLSEHLLYLHVQPLTRRHCGWFSSVFWRDTIACFLPPRRSGICYGDSGSAAIYRNQIVGVTSFELNGCAQNAPDGYARISTLRSWISNFL